MRSQIGFTIVEMLVTLTVASLVGALLLAIFVSNTGVFYRQTAKVTQGVNLNDALSIIKGKIKEAKAASLTYPETGSPTYTSSSQVLVLKLFTIDCSGNVSSTDFDYVVFAVSAGFLNYKVFPYSSCGRNAEDQVISKDVDSINFEYLNSSGMPVATPPDATRIKTTITLKKKAGPNFETNTLTTEANLRNN